MFRAEWRKGCKEQSVVRHWSTKLCRCLTKSHLCSDIFGEFFFVNHFQSTLSKVSIVFFCRSTDDIYGPLPSDDDDAEKEIEVSIFQFGIQLNLQMKQAIY